jgi:hypothetical protein
MFHSAPHSLLGHLANGGGILLVGLMFAFIGLNAASGCGQPGGSCIRVADLAHPQAAALSLAQPAAEPALARPPHARHAARSNG